MKIAKWIAAGGLVFLAALILLPQPFESPDARFRSLVCDPIPTSVRNIRVAGATGLAGSNQTVSFKISPSDFDRVLHARDFQLVPDVPSYIRHQFQHPICYQAKEAKDIVTFTIVTDDARSIVLYNYFKY